jgi:hypothetical protein
MKATLFIKFIKVTGALTAIMVIVLVVFLSKSKAEPTHTHDYEADNTCGPDHPKSEVKAGTGAVEFRLVGSHEAKLVCQSNQGDCNCRTIARSASCLYEYTVQSPNTQAAKWDLDRVEVNAGGASTAVGKCSGTADSRTSNSTEDPANPPEPKPEPKPIAEPEPVETP